MPICFEISLFGTQWLCFLGGKAQVALGIEFTFPVFYLVGSWRLVAGSLCLLPLPYVWIREGRNWPALHCWIWILHALWEDCWIYHQPLQDLYPNLYAVIPNCFMRVARGTDFLCNGRLSGSLILLRFKEDLDRINRSIRHVSLT